MFWEKVIEFIVKTGVFEAAPFLASMFAMTGHWLQDSIYINQALIRSRSGTIERQCNGKLLHSPGQQSAEEMVRW